jgi:hypothetical protein
MWWNVADMVMNLELAQKAENFLPAEVLSIAFSS